MRLKEVRVKDAPFLVSFITRSDMRNSIILSYAYDATGTSIHLCVIAISAAFNVKNIAVR